MSTVRTYTQLAAKLKEIRNKALEASGEKAKDLTTDIMDDVVYGAGTPEEYDRTYELKTSLRSYSISGASSGEATVRIAHDGNLISSSPDDFIHGSNYYSPSDMSEYIPNIVNDGSSGDFFEEGFWSAPRPYRDIAAEQLSGGKYKKFMVDEIKAMGFKVK